MRGGRAFHRDFYTTPSKKSMQRDNFSRCIDFYFSEWQDPFIGQDPHPHPQDDFPFFLSRIMLLIISPTTASNPAPTKKVAIMLPPYKV